MIKNHIRVALRHLGNNKRYMFIHLGGLAIGISCVMLSLLFIADEHSFDTFHANNPNLYRITSTIREKPGEYPVTKGETGQVQGPAFKAAIPELVNYTRVMGGRISGDFIANNKAFTEDILFVDSSFFSVFSFELIEGNPVSALKDINSIVITEEVARKYFNSTAVVGKQMTADANPSAKKTGKPLTITGVVKNPPANSSIDFDVLLPLSFLQLAFTDHNWLNAYLGTFVVLQPGTDTAKITAAFNRIAAVHNEAQKAESMKLYGFAPEIRYGLQPFTNVHLQPMYKGSRSMEGGLINGSNPVYGYILAGIAFFILIMACINFINLSLAGSIRRSKEAGIRKITGGTSMQIIFQYLTESFVICTLALFLALFITYTALPLFNQLSGKQIEWERINFSRGIFITIFLLITLSVITGFYPGWLASSVNPVTALQNRFRIKPKTFIGNGLVVLQFSMGVFLIIASFIYYQQMKFIKTRDLGYNPSEVIRSFIAGDRDSKPIKKILRNELSGEPSIQYVSFGGGGEGGHIGTVTFAGKKMEAVHMVIDEYYLPALDIQLKAGRNFSGSFPSDQSNAVIVNEAFIRESGITEPLGTAIKTDEYFDKETKVIVGVIKDYHYQSLKDPIRPVIMFMNDWYSNGIWIRYDKRNESKALKAWEAAYKKANPTAVLSYSFLDEQNAAEYFREERWQKIIGLATLLSIIVCCLGFYGLAHLASQQRVKEIGIRKVLGAGIHEIMVLIVQRFMAPVGLSILIALPAGAYIMNNWLNDFAYRVKINWWMFAVSAIIAVVIAGITVGTQALKAARNNPVLALRNNE